MSNRYSFNCTNGCGACGVKVVEYETSRTESIETGELIARTFEPQIVSDCCGHAVQVWDDVADDTVGRELRVED